MADIKLTLPQDKCISREAEYMRERGSLYYPLHQKPEEPEQVRWVYFILRDRLVARARALECKEFKAGEGGPLPDYDGEDIGKARWKVKCTDMELPLRTEGGFPGFRYVRGFEHWLFEGAFAWPEE